MPSDRPETTPRERALAVLRDVIRSGDRDGWDHLKSHGHSFSTVWSCIHKGWLSAINRYNYEITPAGRAEVISGR